jgi:mediator of RNA polymerase II transcription subunit 1
MKMLGFVTSAQAVEGYMKTFDSKFQIPKLSARSSNNGGGGSSSGEKGDPVELTSCKKEAKQGPSSAPTTPIPIVQSPNGGGSSSNDSHSAKLFSDFYSNKELSQKYNFPFNKLPGDVSPMHMLPNTMQKMGVSFTHDNSHLHKTSSSDALLYNREGSSSAGGKSSNPTTPTHQTIAPPFPSPGPLNHTPEYSQDTNDGCLMRPPSRPSSTVSNHSHSSDNPLIDFSSSSLSAQILSKLESSQVKITANPSPTSTSSQSSNTSSSGQKAASGASNNTQPLIGQNNSLKSVSVHIVKSPSPLMVIPSSPHSNNSSHGIIDDLPL